MNNENTVLTYIDYVKRNPNLGSNWLVEFLKNDRILDRDDKNLVYAYCYPRALKDGELVSRVANFKARNPEDKTGLTTLLVEATQDPLYANFMKHLMYSFSDHNKLGSLARENLFKQKYNDFFYDHSGECNCDMCGKALYSLETYTEKGYGIDKLAFMSTNSNIILCRDCIELVYRALETIQKIDKNFLEWAK